jgi:N-acetylneuraminic acid mutarotase
MNYARSDLGVVVVDGKIYAIGGSTLQYIQNGSLVDTNERYDPKTDTWITLESMPTPRAYFAIAAYQDKIYCIGGAVGFNMEWVNLYYPACGVNEVYNIATDSWSTKASPPFNGTKLQAHVVNGQIFVLHESDLYMYSPKIDVWETKTSMPLATRLTVSAVVDNKIIVTGEFDTGIYELGLRFEQKTLSYDPKTNAWSEEKQENFSIVFNDAVTGVTTGRYAPQKIYVFDYKQSYYIPADTQVYDPISNVWSVAKYMPIGRSGFGVTVVDDILYAIGGCQHGGPMEPVKVSGINEQYVPIGYHATSSQDAETIGDSLTILIVATIIVTVVAVVTGVILFQKRKNT